MKYDDRQDVNVIEISHISQSEYLGLHVALRLLFDSEIQK